MMEQHRFVFGVGVLLSCAALVLTSCSDSFVYHSPLKTNSGYGPPAHAPAHGYRRKQGQTVVAVGTGTVVGGGTTKATKDGGDKSDATLALAGVAAGAGTVYAVVNERDKAKTRAELDSIRQEMDVVTVNVTNTNGSISEVRLQKQGIGYVGPKGEFYDHLPSSEELQPVYGF